MWAKIDLKQRFIGSLSGRRSVLRARYPTRDENSLKGAIVLSHDGRLVGVHVERAASRKNAEYPS